MQRKTKLYVAALVAALVLIVILQNTEPVRTQVLWFSFTQPRAVLLLLSFAAGLLTGMVWRSVRGGGR